MLEVVEYHEQLLKKDFKGCRSIVDHYHNWKPPKPIKKEMPIDVFAPTLLRNVQATHECYFDDRDITDCTPSTFDDWIDNILRLSLFVDRIWVPDPGEVAAEIHFQTGPIIGIHEGMVRNQENALNAVKALRRLLPLVESGVIVLYPPIRTYRNRISKELFGEVRDFTDTELKNAWPDLFVAEGLAFANAFEASYTCLRSEEYAAFIAGAKTIQDRMGVTDSRVLAVLPHLTLPQLENVNAELITKVRADEEAFKDFRNLLRDGARRLAGGLSDPSFANEIERVTTEFLQPECNRLVEALNGTKNIRENLSNAGIDFSVSALAGFVSTGNPTTGLATGAIGALSKVLINLITQRPGVRSAARTVYAFHTGRIPSQKAGILFT